MWISKGLQNSTLTLPVSHDRKMEANGLTVEESLVPY